jgi:NADPH-dependent curcumin reductase CurA
VVGIAGGPKKCTYVVQELGFDACVDYKQHANGESLLAALKVAAPSGVDCYFESVGGVIGNTVIQCMNAHGRIAMCGLISTYDSFGSFQITHPHLILIQRLLIQGFVVFDDMSFWPTALKELETLVATGQLKHREMVLEGLDAAPAGLISLLHGGNFGKLVVKV